MKFKTSMLISTFWGYSDACILVKGTITAANVAQSQMQMQIIQQKSGT